MWLFELLLRLYPAGFRTEYGDSMRLAAREELAESGWVVFAWRTLADFAANWPALLLAELWQDSRHAIRNWNRHRATTTIAVLSLAIAIGASTAVFSAVNAMLFRDLPFAKVQDLVMLNYHFAPVYKGKAGVEDWVRNSQYLSSALSYSTARFQFGEPGSSLQVTGAETTANFFTVLGTHVWLGRAFLPDEDVPGKTDVAVLSHGLFEQAFGGDRRILGSTITVQHRKLVVVGVAPPNFDYPAGAAFWTPKMFDWDSLPKSGVTFQMTVGRLKAGLTPASAQSAFWAEASQTVYGKSETMKPNLMPLREAVAGTALQSSLLLFAAVVAILLMACGNLAGFLLSRFASREREFQTRMFLGAKRERIWQQILTECTLIGLLAGVLGLALSIVATRWLAAYQSPQAAFIQFERIDWRVLGFGVGSAMICGLVCGGIVCVSGGWKWRQAMTLVQVALAVVLLGLSSRMTRSLLELQQVRPGFATKGVWTASISLAGTNLKRGAYLSSSLERVRQLPGIEAVSAINFLPLSKSGLAGSRYRVPSRREPELALEVAVSPGYFNTVQTRLLAGRDFHAGDERVAIVTQELADLYGGPRQVLGRKLENVPADADSPTVIGVVESTRFVKLDERGSLIVYKPLLKRDPVFFSVVARGSMQPADLSAALGELDAAVPVYDIKPLEDRIHDQLRRPVYLATTMSFFGIFSVGLTLIQLFGACLLQLEQRRKELAIRISLGATVGWLRRFIAGKLAYPIWIGLLVGFLLRGPADQLLEKLLPQEFLAASGIDWISPLLMGLLVALILNLATSGVARLDPWRHLRTE